MGLSAASALSSAKWEKTLHPSRQLRGLGETGRRSQPRPMLEEFRVARIRHTELPGRDSALPKVAQS